MSRVRCVSQEDAAREVQAVAGPVVMRGAPQDHGIASGCDRPIARGSLDRKRR